MSIEKGLEDGLGNSRSDSLHQKFVVLSEVHKSRCVAEAVVLIVPTASAWLQMGFVFMSDNRRPCLLDSPLRSAFSYLSVIYTSRTLVIGDFDDSISRSTISNPDRLGYR